MNECDSNPAVVQHSELIHKGRVFDLYRESLVLPNGVRTGMEIVRHPGAAAIIALNAERQVIMLKQYRHAVAKTLWEIPAGTLEKGEALLECAQRELIEETGFSAEKWEHLGAITPVPGYSDERIQLFLAQDLTLSKRQLDEDEIIQVQTVALDNIVNMITDGRIEDAKTIAGVFLAMQKFSMNTWPSPLHRM